jgi:hypothetical protein
LSPLRQAWSRAVRFGGEAPVMRCRAGYFMSTTRPFWNVMA